MLLYFFQHIMFMVIIQWLLLLLLFYLLLLTWYLHNFTFLHVPLFFSWLQLQNIMFWFLIYCLYNLHTAVIYGTLQNILGNKHLHRYEFWNMISIWYILELYDILRWKVVFMIYKNLICHLYLYYCWFLYNDYLYIVQNCWAEVIIYWSDKF